MGSRRPIKFKIILNASKSGICVPSFIWSSHDIHFVRLLRSINTAHMRININWIFILLKTVIRTAACRIIGTRFKMLKVIRNKNKFVHMSAINAVISTTRNVLFVYSTIFNLFILAAFNKNCSWNKYL